MENEEILKTLKRLDKRSKSTNSWVLFIGIIMLLSVLASIFVGVVSLTSI